MTRQWMRVVRVTVSGRGGSLAIEDLKIDFEVSKSIGSKQNTATIAIWNLSADHRQQLGEEFDSVELEAGYRDGPVSTIFKGNIRDALHSVKERRHGRRRRGKHAREGEADIKSEIECGDGDEGINKGVISETFPAGTKPKEMVQKMARAMPGVTVGEMRGLDSLPATKRATTMYGYCFRELDELSRQHGFYWSIQNGQFEAVKADETMTQTIIVSRETGMIGPPEVSDKGVRVKALLNPEAAPGRVIDVRSEFLDEGSGRDKRSSDDGGGLFRISSITFTGSNRDQAFYMDIDGNRVQGNRVVK